MAKIKKVESSVDGEQPTIVVLDDGTEINLDELDKGFMRQSDYTVKTQALADQKRALESAEANQQVDNSLEQQPDAGTETNEMTKMFLDVKMNQLKNVHGESFDEVAVLKKAADMLSKGIKPTDIDFDFIARGLKNVATDPNLLKEAMRKEILEEIKGKGIDTSSVINSADPNSVDDGTHGLTADELEYCRKTGEDPAVYAKWAKKLRK